MAYVMNPYSYKLGYSLSWSDDWFSNKKLYPIILQIMLTIRYFLIFFWTSRNIEKLDTYLSHLNLTINSGRLLITLFFYEAKMNQPTKYKYKMLKHIIHSIPYSERNAEFKVKWKIKNASVNVRAIRTTAAVRYYFFYANETLDTFESQRFFLFFHFLGLDPASLLLEFYIRYGNRMYGIGSKKKPLKYVIANKRFKSLNKKHSPKMFIYNLEFIFLNRIYKFLNEKIFFFWLYEKEKNLKMIRFLRSLFFYGGMAFFGKHYAPLMKAPGKFFSRFPEMNNKRLSKKLTNSIYSRKKKNKNYNYFLQKLKIMSYFGLLYWNYKKELNVFKKNYNKQNLKNFLEYILKNLLQIRKKKKKKKISTFFC